LGVAWRKLHPDEKRKYKTRAKEVKEHAMNNADYVFTTNNNNNSTAKNYDFVYTLFCHLRDANIALNTLSKSPPANAESP
jgi:hypothetical protein